MVECETVECNGCGRDAEYRRLSETVSVTTCPGCRRVEHQYRAGRLYYTTVNTPPVVAGYESFWGIT